MMSSDDNLTLADRNSWPRFLLPVLSAVLLVIVSTWNFPLFHTLAELFAVTIAIVMAVVAWHTYPFIRNHYLLVLGSGYFWIAILDLAHALTYPGVDVLPTPDFDVSIQIWVSARLLEAMLLLGALFFIRRQPHPYRLNLLFAAGTVLLLALTLNDQLPTMFITGQGLTDTKIWLEYGIIFLLAVALALTATRRALFEASILHKLLAAISLTMLAELAFTVYDSPFAAANMLGHLFKLFSFWFIYEAIIHTSLTDPYQLMTFEQNGMENLEDQVLILDRRGHIRVANARARQNMNRPLTEIIGRHCHELLHPRHLSREECPVCDHIHAGEPLHGYEMHYRDKHAWHELMLTPIFTGSTITGMVHVCHDITERKQLLNAVRENEEKYRNLVENIRGDLFFYTRTADGRYTYVSPSVEETLGYTPENFLNHFQGYLTDHAQNRQALEYQKQYSNRGQQPPIFEIEVYASNSEKHQLEITENPVFDQHHQLHSIEGIAYDITRRIAMDQHLRQTNEQLRLSQQRLSLHIQQTPLAVIEFDDNFIIRQWNQAAERIFGYRADDIIGQHAITLVPPDEQQHMERIWEQLLARQAGFETTSHNLTQDQRTIACDWYNTPLIDETGAVIGVSSLVNDVTERELSEARLQYQANYDSLTKLPNRSLAFDRLEQSLRSAHRYQQAMALLFVDLDNFKHINDTLGHTTGDQMLIEVARRLTQCVRREDTVARLGGDEFLIILPHLHQLQEAKKVAQEVLAALSDPITIEHHELHISASIGITGYPDDGNNPHQLLSHADTAMYGAKESGRNTFSFFTREMSEQVTRRMNLENQLRYAIDRGELNLHFQPQIDLKNNKLVGAEALLRWHNQKFGPISPMEFIPLAEDTGLIHDIGQWVLLEACRAAARWQNQHGQSLRVSVNFSPQQVRGKNCVEMVHSALHNSGLPTHLLEIEITENILLEHAPSTYHLLQSLKNMGVRLSLDDFGTGYSSLSYLKRFPFDALKIDRSFVQDIFTDSGDAALCEAIISLANILNLEVIGEGTETAEQVEFLRQRGATMVQGYYFSKPLPEKEFVHFMQQNHRNNA